jgi:phospholipase C
MIRKGFLTVILIAMLTAGQIAPALAASTPSQPPTKTPIQHLVVILQENHSFDN